MAFERHGMMAVREHYDRIVAFSRTDFTEDIKKTDAPVKGRSAFCGREL
jgi:hypothetical protein